MKAVFWLFVFGAVAGIAILVLQLRRRWLARKEAEEARAMMVIAEVMRARAPGKDGPGSGSPPGRKQP
ncbi:MAG: hypothetical protein AB7F95_01340 [Burkholderiales bacterium]